MGIMLIVILQVLLVSFLCLFQRSITFAAIQYLQLQVTVRDL